MKRRRDRAVDVLVLHGVLKPEVRLQLVRLLRTSVAITDDNAKKAAFLAAGRNGIRWEYDGALYSLSGLCKTICERFGEGPIGEIQGPDYWAIEGESSTLSERAASLANLDVPSPAAL
jgi:hypothetical protein